MTNKEIVEVIMIYDEQIERLQQALYKVKSKRMNYVNELSKRVDNVAVEEFLIKEEIKKERRK